MARDYIDAKFKVIRPARVKRGWRIYIDWQHFWIIAGLVLASGLPPLVQSIGQQQGPAAHKPPVAVGTGSQR